MDVQIPYWAPEGFIKSAPFWAADNSYLGSDFLNSRGKKSKSNMAVLACFSGTYLDEPKMNGQLHGRSASMH